MPLVAGCPRCRADVETGTHDGRPRCPVHGDVAGRCGARRRPVSYDAFADHLRRGRRLPDVPAVADEPGLVGHRLRRGRRGDRPWATATCVSGTSELDGPVDVFVVAEEPGTGLGSRCAGIDRSDPGREVGEGQPTVRVRIGSQTVPLWVVSTSTSDDALRPVGLRRRGRRAAGCGWCCGPPRRCCCCATTGSCATSRRSGRRWSRCRSEGPVRSGEPGERPRVGAC